MKMLLPVVLIVGASNFRPVSAQAPSCETQELAIEAALGDAEAQYNLGVAFHRGDVLTRDYAKAAAMWRLASEGGIVQAYNNLGHLTYYGRGVKQDLAEGLRLWKIAAAQGFAESVYHIGFAYGDGKFLPVDWIEAYAHAKVAGEFASAETDAELIGMASRLRVKAEARLSPAQKKTAEQKVVEYRRKFAPRHDEIPEIMPPGATAP